MNINNKFIDYEELQCELIKLKSFKSMDKCLTDFFFFF